MGEADRSRDGRVGLCCAIGATGWLGVAEGGPGWLGERESEQREKKRAEKKNRERAQAVWLGVARVAVGRVRREQRAETVRKREQR